MKATLLLEGFSPAQTVAETVAWTQNSLVIHFGTSGDPQKDAMIAERHRLTEHERQMPVSGPV